MTRDSIDHVVILDGTLSSLVPERQSNAGITYKLLCEQAGRSRLSLHYQPGIQWMTWSGLIDVIAGHGLTRQIEIAYGNIASRYRPGDRIYLFGFSRGAYAVRSLAGVIDSIGLLRPEHATERNIRQVFRFYRDTQPSDAARQFAKTHCEPDIHIEMIGVWDTVKALGISWPLLWRFSPRPTNFHNHTLGQTTRHGFHALAMDETRQAFTPVLWASKPGWKGRLEQIWFRGSHGDVGGFLGRFQAARPLANIPLVWMLDRAESCGLALPAGWRDRFPTDPMAPAHGAWRGVAKFYLFRRRRVMLQDPSESLHLSVETWQKARENRVH